MQFMQLVQFITFFSDKVPQLLTPKNYVSCHLNTDFGFSLVEILEK